MTHAFESAPAEGRDGRRRSVFSKMFRRSDPALRLPPDPPLLSGNAVEPVLRDVGLLLDYLNRLPEMRLESCFRPINPQLGAVQGLRLTPPCSSQAYFLGRIAAIAALGSGASTIEITEPKTSSQRNGDQADLGAGEAKHLGNLAFLIWSRDLLAALASPATLDTIRVTRAFRAGRMMNSRHTETDRPHLDTADERDIFMSRYGLAISNRVGQFQILAMLLLWFSVYISVMVYSGQVLLSENSKLQADMASFATRLEQTISQETNVVQESLQGSSNDEKAIDAIGYCDLGLSFPSPLRYVAVGDAMTDSKKAASPSFNLAQAMQPTRQGTRVYISQRQRSLCSEKEELEERKSELRRSEGAWVEAASPVIALSTPLPGVVYFLRTIWREVFDWNREPPQRALETQRYAMQQLLNGLLAGIMPAMYAALGALVSLFRRLAAMAAEEKLGPAEYGGMMSSLVLGGLTGAVIGLFASVVPQVGQSAGLPLATTALALLAGYAADRVFAMFDNLAQRIFVLQAGADGKR